MFQNQMRKLLVPGLFACTGILTGCQAPAGSSTAVTASSPAAESAVGSSGGCSTGSASFTYPITDVESLKFIEALPALAGGVALEGRTYMHLKQQYAGIPVPIYAPTDVTVVAAKQYRIEGVSADYLNDWEMFLEVNCDVTIMLAHLKKVDPRIAENTTAPIDASSAPVELRNKIKFKAGEIIGWYIKSANSIAWDFLVLDRTITNDFINQERYLSDQNKLLNVRCPYDFYTDESLKSQFTSLLGINIVGAPIPGMVCGSVNQDVKGTAAGTWFKNPAASSGSRTFSTDGTYGSMINLFYSKGGVTYVTGFGANGSYKVVNLTNASFVDPSNVLDEHCFGFEAMPGNLDGFVYVKVISNSEMRIKYQASGACPTQLPEDAVSYYR